MRHRLFVALLVLISLALSACVAAETPTVSQASDTPAVPDVTETALPTATEASTDTPTATLTSTATLTPTLQPTEFTGFQFASVFKAFAYVDETLFYFIVPGVASPYYGTVDGVDLICETDEEQENLLFCRAEEDLFGTDWKSFKFYSDEAKSFLVYEGDFSTTLDKIPPTPTPPGFIWPLADFTSADIFWGDTPPGCMARGVGLNCETEYRIYEDGSCLVGMSCYDDCGYYYSVDTIRDHPGTYIFADSCWH
jgi:hypothetical protein